MRKYAVLAAAAGLALTGVAKADFIITSTRAPGTGQFVGDDVVTFNVQNDGLGGQVGTTKLLAADVTVSSKDPNPKFFIHTFDQDGSGINDDADLSAIGSTGGSFVRFGSAAGWTVVSTTPPLNSPDDSVTIKNTTPYSDGQSLPQFEVAGASNLTGGGTSDATPKALAVAVVPAGQQVHLSGSLGAENGPKFDFTADNPVPEPASLGLIGLGAVGLIRRRRRA